MSETPEQPTFCLRCKTIQLVVLQSAAEITFFACPQCRRQYARKPGVALVSRWLDPLSLALYGVIFQPDALPHAPRLARHLAQGKDRATIEALAREIQLELDEPTQPVSEILDMAAPKSEEHLREYLRLFVEHLRQAQERAEQSPGSA